MEKQRIIYLLKAYQTQTATSEERTMLAEILHNEQYEKLLAEIFDQNWDELKSEEINAQQVAGYAQILQYIKAQPHTSHIAVPSSAMPIAKSRWPRLMMAAAAVMMAIISVSLYFYTSKNTSNPAFTTAQDIAPGKNGATLTLANGKKILISEALTGNIANEAGVKITKTAQGQLIYEIVDDVASTGLNTLSTTRGEQMQVRLPDGTVVFLNAESMLRYPSRFDKAGKREVALSGEGYFEVAKDKQHPFVVNLLADNLAEKGQNVQVLGTIFNISNYADEAAVKTTLLEGSVQVNHQLTNKSVILKPGEQAIVNDRSMVTKTVETDDVVAWKNGVFMFNYESLEHIMKKVERWYDVEVVYNDNALRQRTFFGTVSRFDKVSELLKMLQKTEGAVFEIKGRQIIVSPKK